MNIVAYCRVSTNKDDQLNSMETQKKFFEEFSNRYNHNLIKIYADEGISGTKIKNRKEFNRLMKDAEKGLFQMVVVKDISRFARNAVDFLQGIRYLKSKGIACNFVNANLSTSDSEMVLGTLALVAQEESGNTSKRIKFSKKINAEKGKIPNIVYGYNKIIGDYFNLSINLPEAEVIKRIFHMYTIDGFGQNKIANILNSEHITTKRNCKWTQNAISRILSNELYTGKVINGKQEIKDFLTGVRSEKDESEWKITNREDFRIVDDITFQAAQDVVNKRYTDFRINKERHSDKYVFSTLIKCKCCGYSFRRVERTYKNTYVRWVCSGRNAHGTGSCVNKTVIDEAELLESIRDYFIQLLNNKPNVINNVIKEFNKIYQSRDNNAVNEKNLKNDLAKLKRNKQKYIQMFENDIININELKDNTKETNSGIQHLENQLQIIQYNLDTGNQLEQILNATFRDIESMVQIDTVTNALLKKVIKKIEVDELGKVDIYLNLFSDIGLDESVLISDNRT